MIDFPIYCSGDPFDFTIDLSSELSTDATVSIVVWSCHFGRHLHGAIDRVSVANDIAIEIIDGNSLKVSVTGEKCRLLDDGFVHYRVVIYDADGAISDVKQSIVAEIGKYYHIHKIPDISPTK